MKGVVPSWNEVGPGLVPNGQRDERSTHIFRGERASFKEDQSRNSELEANGSVEERELRLIIIYREVEGFQEGIEQRFEASHFTH